MGMFDWLKTRKKDKSKPPERKPYGTSSGARVTETSRTTSDNSLLDPLNPLSPLSPISVWDSGNSDVNRPSHRQFGILSPISVWDSGNSHSDNHSSLSSDNSSCDSGSSYDSGGSFDSGSCDSSSGGGDGW